MQFLRPAIFFILILFFHSSLFSVNKVSVKTLRKLFSVLKKSQIKYRFRGVKWKKAEKIYTPRPVYRTQDVKQVQLLRRSVAAKSSGIRQSIINLLKSYPDDYYLTYLLASSFLNDGMKKKAGALFFKSFLFNRGFNRAWKGLLKSGFSLKNRRPIIERARATHYSPGVVFIYYDIEYKRNRKYYPWMTFAMGQALWRFESFYTKRFPRAPWYRESFEEKLFCYKILAYTWKRAREKRKGLVDPDMDYLLELDQNDMLAGYVFFEVYKPIIQKYNSYILKKYKRSINRYFESLYTDK